MRSTMCHALKIVAFSALPLLAACSEKGSDPFEGIVPGANGSRPLTAFNNEYALATGIWRIDDEKSAFPYNVTEIACTRREMACRTASAELLRLDDYKFLSVSQSGFDIDSWSENEIVFSSSGGCRTTTTKMSNKDGSVVETIETDLTLPTCTAEVRSGPAGDVLTKPRIVRMITTDEWRKLEDKS